MKKPKEILVYCVMFSLLVQYADSVTCYSCHDCDDGYQSQPTVECLAGCFKETNTPVGERTSIHRRCAARPGNKCDHASGTTGEYYQCVCTSDYCNAGNTAKAHLALICVTMTFVYSYMLL
ncbi:uncharacterized protein LOC106172107 [Lingula anatina]|uniref:Uncharacterized protein LOC106172107 n=1 Tax=Lingula anatina TaxID=7574 RepID=A0A1S3JDB1_LINAN|nr:uncharacterized protein LOC106172107 [Lingula anatina]|eukprot:XP_013408156.1 uncharacterized protein LOC106172107 [Lingula anatina]